MKTLRPGISVSIPTVQVIPSTVDWRVSMAVRMEVVMPASAEVTPTFMR